MSFDISSFKTYGIEADEAISKRNKQIAIFEIHNTDEEDTDLWIGDFSSGFWSQVSAQIPEAMKSIADINERSDSFIGLGGSLLNDYVQILPLPNSYMLLLSGFTSGATSTTVNLSITDLSDDDQIISVTANDLDGGLTPLRVLCMDSNIINTPDSPVVEYLVLGLLGSDTILSVSPRTKGATNASLVCMDSYSDDSMEVAYTADPGSGASIFVTALRNETNPNCAPVTAYSFPRDGTGTMNITFAIPPPDGTSVNVSVVRTASGPSLGPNEFVLAMDDEETNIPNITFSSGFAPEPSYTVILQWNLKDGELPLQYEART